MSELTYSDRGFALTQQFEGLRLESYQDCAGVWTIGYGHTGPEVAEGQSITLEEAQGLLRADLARAVACVNRAVTVPLNQNQFDALVDFCFNCGSGNLIHSTLLRKVNLGDFAGAAEQLALWDHAGGKVVEGLVKRRAAEAEMFAGTAVQLAASASEDHPTDRSVSS